MQYVAIRFVGGYLKSELTNVIVLYSVRKKLWFNFKHEIYWLRIINFFAENIQEFKMASSGSVPRTRHKSGTHMSEFLGTGKGLLVSDLPTLRDVLRCGILLWEQHDEDLKNY